MAADIIFLPLQGDDAGDLLEVVVVVSRRHRSSPPARRRRSRGGWVRRAGTRRSCTDRGISSAHGCGATRARRRPLEHPRLRGRDARMGQADHDVVFVGQPLQGARKRKGCEAARDSRRNWHSGRPSPANWFGAAHAEDHRRSDGCASSRLKRGAARFGLDQLREGHRPRARP
jgi:hypothetical protein